LVSVVFLPHTGHTPYILDTSYCSGRTLIADFKELEIAG